MSKKRHQVSDADRRRIEELLGGPATAGLIWRRHMGKQALEDERLLIRAAAEHNLIVFDFVPSGHVSPRYLVFLPQDDTLLEMLEAGDGASALIALDRLREEHDLEPPPELVTWANQRRRLEEQEATASAKEELAKQQLERLHPDTTKRLKELARLIREGDDVIDQSEAAADKCHLEALHQAHRVGDWLLEAKRLVGHGHWLPWLIKQRLSDQKAQRNMRIARHWAFIEGLLSNPSRLTDLRGERGWSISSVFVALRRTERISDHGDDEDDEEQQTQPRLVGAPSAEEQQVVATVERQEATIRQRRETISEAQEQSEQSRERRNSDLQQRRQREREERQRAEDAAFTMQEAVSRLRYLLEQEEQSWSPVQRTYFAEALHEVADGWESTDDEDEEE